MRNSKGQKSQETASIMRTDPLIRREEGMEYLMPLNKLGSKRTTKLETQNNLNTEMRGS